MSASRHPARITVLSGNFASQPLAFARLLDAVERAGGDVDLAAVDVIRHAPETRLAHYFRPAVVATIETLQNQDDTLLLLKPDASGTEWSLSLDDPMLRPLGVFEGEVLRAPIRGKGV